VLDCPFATWFEGHKQLPMYSCQPVIEIIRGGDRLFVCNDDVLLKLCGDQDPPSITQLVNALSQIWPNTQIKQIHGQVLKGAKLKNMWKDLLLIYTMALNPHIELWRAGAMAMLVDRFIGRLDPLAAKHKSGDDHMRRHMTLMVMGFHSKNWAKAFKPALILKMKILLVDYFHWVITNLTAQEIEYRN